ncbi:MAG: shikimate dehydrogenase [Deltaproteobacteria bacterium]|uniref:shikimate dehydrogenase n=1 Tax=Desulfobacula sp. TaxID=2593537 RepID=UPI00198D725E|nr:shikimate dehydrogenase [Candidatus Desulfobacula maris]MBL6993701.1 shikimate dehydrogenase [Desulfobacula sp.]
MIDSNTQLYCVFGNPVRHSKSPAIHNAGFQHHHINAVYLAFEIDEISKGVAALKSLNIQGASITIPFKESIMDYLDWIDDDAIMIGAVNTIKNKNGKLFGYNTDHQAAIAPLKPFGIKDKKVCLIGAGGAAQAVAYGIHKEKGNLVIINRDKVRGEKLALKYDADFIPLNEIDKSGVIKADIIINTTSIGMYPDIENIAFPIQYIESHMVIMDIIYNPLKTKLLSEAKIKGCTTIDGLSMFLHQGGAQFKLWTGITPDIKWMRQALINGDT